MGQDQRCLALEPSKLMTSSRGAGSAPAARSPSSPCCCLFLGLTEERALLRLARDAVHPPHDGIGVAADPVAQRIPLGQRVAAAARVLLVTQLRGGVRGPYDGRGSWQHGR